MSRVLVTGSAEGLGRDAAQKLLDDGHEVVAHARSRARAAVLGPLLDAGASVVVGDLADQEAVRALAAELTDLGLDAVIHNAGVMTGLVRPVNVVAPYLLTALLPGVRRHVYLSSAMHRGGRADVEGTSYSDSKLLVTALAFAVARRRPEALSNAVNPGWVPTRMGGPGAPDDREQGSRTQVWLATSDAAEAVTSGGYWHHLRRQEPHASTRDEGFQQELLRILEHQTATPLRP